MSTTDVFTIYDRFGNFFRMNYEMGKLYRYEDDPREKIGPGKTIFFRGYFYSYERSIDAVEEDHPSIQILKSMITRQFALKLQNNGYRFKGEYRVYKPDYQLESLHRDIFSVYDGFVFRTVVIGGSILLCIDPHITFSFNASIKTLIDKGIRLDQLKDFSVTYSGGKIKRIDGYLLETLRQKGTNLVCRIKNYRNFTEEIVPAEIVFPEARPELIQETLKKLNRPYDVVALQRKLSFLDSKTASRDRLLKTLEIAKELQERIFPLEFGQFKVELEIEPIVIRM
jgi:hypothetical protein